MKSIVIAAATAFVCTLGIQGASAATSTVNVNNVNDPINHPYQESDNSNCGSSFCTLTFGTITAPEAVVQHVSCHFITVTGTVLYNAELYDATNTNNENYLPVFSWGSTGGYDDDAIDENTQLFFTKGGEPALDVNATGNIEGLFCTISGYHR